MRPTFPSRLRTFVTSFDGTPFATSMFDTEGSGGRRGGAAGPLTAFSSAVSDAPTTTFCGTLAMREGTSSTAAMGNAISIGRCTFGTPWSFTVGISTMSATESLFPRGRRTSVDGTQGRPSAMHTSNLKMKNGATCTRSVPCAYGILVTCIIGLLEVSTAYTPSHVGWDRGASWLFEVSNRPCPFPDSRGHYHHHHSTLDQLVYCTPYLYVA